ncbi:hypothetical protein MPH_08878 [Macrophomina phaseolina MS6]|uniref:Uncharacterized protein n=1 Tax=Macrophomina phaseolina (strain MS6) TaxID=1126212 RepID=K2RUU9_MACPH|nr:hypothetical protein MPH_08878 [Macrophomina phaseolina MS6]
MGGSSTPANSRSRYHVGMCHRHAERKITQASAPTALGPRRMTKQCMTGARIKGFRDHYSLSPIIRTRGTREKEKGGREEKKAFNGEGKGGHVISAERDGPIRMNFFPRSIYDGRVLPDERPPNCPPIVRRYNRHPRLSLFATQPKGMKLLTPLNVEAVFGPCGLVGPFLLGRGHDSL